MLSAPVLVPALQMASASAVGPAAALPFQLLGGVVRRTHENRSPQVVGIDISELENSAALYSDSGSQQAEAAVGQAAKALLKEGAGGREEDGGDGGGAGGGLGDRDGDAHPLWGQREDRQIQVSGVSGVSGVRV